MEDGKLGFGIIGCGEIAVTHRAAIDACDEAELVAVCDVDEQRAREFASTGAGVRDYRDHENLVRDPRVDVVCICTPPGLHADAVIAAAQGSKHALCEKPLEVTRERMTRMISACREAKVKLGCVFQYRTRPEMIAVREALRSGNLGPLVVGDAYLKKYRSRAYYESVGWRGTWSVDGGGVLMNQGIHGIDLLLWLMNDEVQSVFARGDHKVRDIEGLDTVVACVTYESGAYGVIEATASSNPGEPERIELHGRYGTICVNSWAISRWAITREEDGRAQDTRPPLDPGDAGAEALIGRDHAGLVQDMVRAIKEDRDPYITGESARKGVDLALAIHESIRTGRDIRLDTT
jgi:UDP-N-acetyl-2-amino-2-deoxyglucuronate dehydrogenase